VRLRETLLQSFGSPVTPTASFDQRRETIDAGRRSYQLRIVSRSRLRTGEVSMRDNV
jgi:hypothetical protein